MSFKTVAFVALVFVALALVPSGAHVAELLNKIELSRDEYLVVQQIYRGWALFGMVVIGAILSTLAVTVMLRGTRSFRLALTALLCLVGTQVIFWTWTFPVNQITDNWTVLPPNWAELRQRWEYSHAASAALNLAALMVLVRALLGTRDPLPRAL